MSPILVIYDMTGLRLTESVRSIDYITYFGRSNNYEKGRLLFSASALYVWLSYLSLLLCL